MKYVLIVIPRYLIISLSLILKSKSPLTLNFLKNVSIKSLSISLCFFNKLINKLFFSLYYNLDNIYVMYGCRTEHTFNIEKEIEDCVKNKYKSHIIKLKSDTM